MTEELIRLIEWARAVPITEERFERMVRSFAYGNLLLSRYEQEGAMKCPKCNAAAYQADGEWLCSQCYCRVCKDTSIVKDDYRDVPMRIGPVVFSEGSLKIKPDADSGYIGELTLPISSSVNAELQELLIDEGDAGVGIVPFSVGDVTFRVCWLLEQNQNRWLLALHVPD